MLRPGDVVGGKYRLIRPIGSGGMATVFQARHELLGRDVALKLAPAVHDVQGVTRFVREAEIIGKFDHRNIVRVIDAGELADEGYVFLAMELLHGSTLADELESGEPLAADHVLRVLIDVCSGLEVAHAMGVVHRDMKPENIVLAEMPGEGIVPKIDDFGISYTRTSRAHPITVEGQLLGTPAYMSPEQACGS